MLSDTDPRYTFRMFELSATLVTALLVISGAYLIATPSNTKVTTQPPDQSERLQSIQHVGTVVRHDIEANTILVDEKVSIPIEGASSTLPVLFQYDDRSNWASALFFFEDDISIGRRLLPDHERQLPQGTIVNILVGNDAGNVYAQSITILRRETI